MRTLFLNETAVLDYIGVAMGVVIAIILVPLFFGIKALVSANRINKFIRTIGLIILIPIFLWLAYFMVSLFP
jgi:hypothetical protein